MHFTVLYLVRQTPEQHDKAYKLGHSLTKTIMALMKAFYPKAGQISF